MYAVFDGLETVLGMILREVPRAVWQGFRKAWKKFCKRFWEICDRASGRVKEDLRKVLVEILERGSGWDTGMGQEGLGKDGEC